MAVKKTDRRAMKTRKAIFAALAELLTEKELRLITVQELSDKADIHRVTLYKHFYDIYDVYEQLEKEILSDVGFMIADFGGLPSDELYHAILHYVAEHPVYFKMIFSPHNTGMLYHKLLKTFEGLKRMIWTEKLGIDLNNTAVESVIRYHANGCFAVISDWVMNDFKQPQDDVIKMLSGLEKSTHQYLASLLR